MDDQRKPDGFVSLASVKKGAPDPASALADIRRIYFATTKKTIDNDFAHAIELLKALPTEEDRERATVFMEGLATMRREWGLGKKGAGKQGAGKQGAGEKRAAKRSRTKP